MASNYNYDELAHLWHKFTVFGPPIDQATCSPMDFCERLDTEDDNRYGLPEVEQFFREKERREAMALPQVALTQEQILTYVDAAIVVLEAETGRMATTDGIQEYLQVQFGIKEPLERIAEASALVYEIRLKAEIEE